MSEHILSADHFGVEPLDNRWRKIVARTITLWLMRIEIRVEAKTKEVWRAAHPVKVPYNIGKIPHD